MGGIAAWIFVLCGSFRSGGDPLPGKNQITVFFQLRVFPLTVHDTNMMDYAINEASFGLTVAGCDR